LFRNERQRGRRVEGGGLAAEVTSGIDQVPDDRLLDPETPPRLRDADACMSSAEPSRRIRSREQAGE